MLGRLFMPIHAEDTFTICVPQCIVVKWVFNLFHVIDCRWYHRDINLLLGRGARRNFFFNRSQKKLLCIKINKGGKFQIISSAKKGYLPVPWKRNISWKEIPYQAKKCTDIPKNILLEKRTLFPVPFPRIGYIPGNYIIWYISFTSLLSAQFHIA